MTELHYEKDSLTREPWEHYLAEYKKTDPQEIAQRLQIPFDAEKRTFSVRFLGRDYQISHPDFEISHPGEDGYFALEDMIKARILTLRYLLYASASEGSGAFKTYREMPWGEVYLRQFDGRCIKRLAFSYGNKIDVFSSVMEKMGAVKTHHGDISYRMEIYPGYMVEMILWEGDEEFPPSSQFLFSPNFPLGFQAEDVAQMGDCLISAMKKL